MASRIVEKEKSRARRLAEVLDHYFGKAGPRTGVEFGTRGGITGSILLTKFRKLDLITVDNYLAMPWLTGSSTQREKQDHRGMAVQRLNPFGSRCTLWEMEARAAAMILRGYRADFVYTDLIYHVGWSRHHLPMFAEIVRSGGFLAGGGWHQDRYKNFLQGQYPDVQGAGTLWWKIV